MMLNIDTEYIENFAIEEDEILYSLNRETALTQVNNNQMCSGKYQGKLLNFLTKITNAQKILEIGTFTGYSTICFARALPENGKIYTIERNDEIEWLAKKYFKLADLEHKIEAKIGDALKIIPTINETFDIIFIDGDKKEYLQYYEISLPKLKKNGLIIVDNVLWYNKIFNKTTSNDYKTKSIIEFNNFIEKDSRCEKIIIALRDGLMLLKKN